MKELSVLPEGRVRGRKSVIGEVKKPNMQGFENWNEAEFKLLPRKTANVLIAFPGGVHEDMHCPVPMPALCYFSKSYFC